MSYIDGPNTQNDHRRSYETAKGDQESPDRRIEAETERDTRHERIEKLEQDVERLFAGERLAELRADIRRSFDVPQWGEYHNEGMLMDRHLEEILSSIDDLARGEGAEEVPQDVHDAMRELAAQNPDALRRYTYLHDIAKPDCMTVKYDDEQEDEEVEWSEWQQRLADAGLDTENPDPVALKQFCRDNGIVSISYFQKSKGEDGKHGPVGAERARSYEGAAELPAELITAVEKHEAAFQFPKVSAKTAEKLTADLSEEAITWLMTASYIDTAASVRSEGGLDFTNFRNMVDSIHNVRVLQEAHAALEPDGNTAEGLDPEKVQKKLAEMRKSERRLGDPETELEQARKECRVDTYDRDTLQGQLSALVEGNVITDEQKQQIAETVDEETGVLDATALKSLRKELGKANKQVQAALEEAKW